MITNTEIELLNSVNTEDAWNDACDTIKQAHGGDYPGDWFRKVLLGGVMADFEDRMGAS